MKKIGKFLKHLPEKERDLVEAVIERIRSRELAGLNIKKLKGYPDYFRAKVHRFRVIFFMNEGVIEIIDIDRRDDNTYRQF